MHTMFRMILIASIAVTSACQAQAQEPEAQEAQPAAESGELQVDQATSYAVGYQVGTNFAEGGLELEPTALVEGLKAGMAGAEPRYELDAMQQALMALQERAMEVQQARAQVAAEAAREMGAAFLATNAQREGVTVLPSGLQYEVIEPGTGAKPQASDRVTVHYRGSLPDGTVFDSSYDRGEPATFPVGGVIPGFREGLQLMQEGAKYRLFIPAELGYGDRGAGAIPPGSVLVFEMELVKVEAAAPPAPSTPQNQQ